MRRAGGRSVRPLNCGVRFHVAQRIETLNEQDNLRVAAQRKWVVEHYEPHAQHEYESLGGKLKLLSTIVRQKWVEPNETVKLQCLGIALGDALAQELGMRWVAVEDEYGRDPALELPRYISRDLPAYNDFKANRARGGSRCAHPL